MQIAASNDDVVACFDVMKELRPQLSRDQFLDTIRRMQQEGYQLGFLKNGEEVVSVAGFRTCLNFAAEGKALYVYDFVTSAGHRSKGFGSKMLHGLERFAHENHCVIVHLDSGVFRYQAHKFYLANDYEIRAHHFLKRIDEKLSTFDQQGSAQLK